MKRTWLTWLLFGLCLAVLLTAMAWLSLAALRLEGAEAEARRQTATGERVRLALWRMDSSMAMLIGQEDGRSYFMYSAFYPVPNAYTPRLARIPRGNVLVPSPLLTFVSPQVLVHFQFDAQGILTSPQVPTLNMRDIAESSYTTRGHIERASTYLAQLGRITGREWLLDALAKSDSALRKREHYAEVQGRQMLRSESVSPPANTPADVEEGSVQAIWVGQELVLARRVVVDGAEVVQGCWLDWPRIRQSLLDSVQDVLPNADLQPLRQEDTDRADQVLATLPVRLRPGAAPFADEAFSPLLLSVFLAWGGVLLAACLAAVLLRSALVLSERRGAFVSAVTHELRTPLTTFRMYAEMLSEKMVPDEEKRMQYLNTLRVEADRLSHLVENVLAYARLESGRARRREETIRLNGLLDRVTDRLSSRAEQANMDLVVEVGEEDGNCLLRTDTSAVEQILFNLVDNACKYAAQASDRRIHLSARRSGPVVVLNVCDHGPGVPPDVGARLFKPFSKSAQDAALSAPGVGLGLALSRRLALEIGGELALDETVTSGACFELVLQTQAQA